MDDTTKYLIEQSSAIARMEAKLDGFIARIEAIEGNDMNRCKDCETSRRLEEHITSSEKQLDRKWVIAGILIAGGLSLLGILLQVAKII